MTPDRLLHFVGARTGSPATAPAPTRVVRRQTQRLHFCQGPAEMRCVSVSCSGGEGGRAYKDAGVTGTTELVWRVARMATDDSFRLVPLGDDYLSTEGLGPKLKFAFETGIHDTIGIDLVAMGINDVITLGAKPLQFLYCYIPSMNMRKLHVDLPPSKLELDLAQKVVEGVLDGCRQSDCVPLRTTLVAGRPTFAQGGQYDLTGIAAGLVKKDKVIDGKNINKGDVLIGLSSNGLHSNGFSVARRVLKRSGLSLSDHLPRNDGITTTIGEALMAPTVIYVKQVLEIISKGGVKGLVHITDGGFTENIPRVFPSGLGAKIFTGSWEVPPVFDWLQKVGNIEAPEMQRTFNMGIGMVLVVSKESADRIIEDTHGSNSIYQIGEVIQDEGIHYA